jgi:putative transposase
MTRVIWLKFLFIQKMFLCRAVCFELSGKTVSLKEVIRARNARRREVRENLVDLLRMADKHVPAERLAKDAALSSVVHVPEYPKFKIKRFACDDD